MSIQFSFWLVFISFGLFGVRELHKQGLVFVVVVVVADVVVFVVGWLGGFCIIAPPSVKADA